MDPLHKIGAALQEVYKRRKYYFFTIFFSLTIFSLNPLSQNYSLLTTNFSLSLAWSLIIASPWTTSLYAFSILILLSLLAGIVLSLSIFLVKKQIKSGIGVGISGIVVGLLAPACPACAFGLLSILGLGSFLALLPFKGAELGIMGIILLVLSIYYSSNKITATVCPIRKK